jgi:uncharacterized membrane protein
MRCYINALFLALCFVGGVFFCYKISPIIALWVTAQDYPKMALIIVISALGLAGVICKKSLGRRCTE